MNKTQEKNFPVTSKVIAVWGSPNAGKTTFAAKLAKSIYDRYSTTVLVLHTDNVTPDLPVLFPNYKADELYSVGATLAKPDITQADLLKNIITLKNKNNLGFVGYMDGENKFTYPVYDESKAIMLINVMKSIADYVIVDCTSTLENVLTSVALERADSVIRLCVPSLKNMSFFTSQLALYTDPKYNLDEQIIGINITEKDIYSAVEETKVHFKEVRFVLPYCREVKQQMSDGKILENVIDKKYNTKLNAIADKVV